MVRNSATPSKDALSGSAVRFVTSIVTAVVLGGVLGLTAYADDQASHPFIGCWETEDGLSKEQWIADPSGWMFGYALDRGSDGSVLFFEQVRIEVIPEAPNTFVVVGARDGDIVRFAQEAGEENEYRFVNAEHDYPQVITYRPNGDELNAEISKLDGSDARQFNKKRCS